MTTGRAWGTGNRLRCLYRYNHREAMRRIGSCDWFPEDGDLCLCTEHTGDCFNDYVVIREGDDGLYHVVGDFGAYAFGTVFCHLSKRTFHLLMAGEPIALELEILRGNKP